MAQEKLQPEYMDTLKKERDRFVALAFCAADILFEVDKDQKITYAAGATKALTDFQPHDVIGKSFIELIDSAERDYVGRRLEGLGSANRLPHDGADVRPERSDASADAHRLPPA